MNDFLISILKKYYNDEQIEYIFDGFLIKKNNYFRINYCKCLDDEVIENELNSENILFEKLNLFDLLNKKIEYEKQIGFLNNTNFNIEDNKECFENIFFYSVECDINVLTQLDIFKKGLIYLQNPSTLIPVLLFDFKYNDDVLDMCAAPGGKTCFMQSLMKNKLNIMAIELNKNRYEKMKYNFKLQNANVYSKNMNVLDLDDNLKYDKILLDAPCSGSGTLNINNTLYLKFFTDELIQKSIKKQINLLNKSKKLVKKDGQIVYSTCSILDCENNDIIDKCDIKKCQKLTILPDKYFEGFFVSKIDL